MKSLDYLKFAIKHKCYYKRAWIVSVFATIKEDPEAGKVDLYTGKIVKQAWGFSFVNEQGELEPIEGVKANELIFRFKDRLTIDSSWCVNVQDPIETSIGNLLFNEISITSSFGKKLEFQLGRVSISSIEDKLAANLQNTPDSEANRSTEYFYVDEYINFVNSLQFISSLSQITCWAATPKTMTAPIGITEFKKELVEKYKGKLQDPVELSKFEKELLDFDAEYLKGDPSDGTFVKGKIKNIARKKMFLTIGAEEGFESGLKLTPVINSLQDGIPKDPVEFTALMNGLRSGSFSRGAETVKGGVSAKILLRAANNFKIVDTDCESKLGIHRTFSEDNVLQLVGRYIVAGKLLYMENKNIAVNYLNQELVVRSPMYCKLSGDTICKVCAGDKISQFPTGITIPLTEISGIILAASLAKMHGKSLTTAKLELNKAFT